MLIEYRLGHGVLVTYIKLKENNDGNILSGTGEIIKRNNT